MGNVVVIPGLAVLLRHLTQRFAPLADETSMRGITDLMSFGRLPSESIDAALVEYGVDRRRYPADAVTALVMTFNQGVQMEATGGVRHGHKELIAMTERVR